MAHQRAALKACPSNAYVPGGCPRRDGSLPRLSTTGQHRRVTEHAVVERA